MISGQENNPLKEKPSSYKTTQDAIAQKLSAKQGNPNGGRTKLARHDQRQHQAVAKSTSPKYAFTQLEAT